MEGTVSVAQQDGDFIQVVAGDDDVLDAVAAQAEQVGLGGSEAAGDGVIRCRLECTVAVAQLDAERIGLEERGDQILLAVSVDVGEHGPAGQGIGAGVGGGLRRQGGGGVGGKECYVACHGVVRGHVGEGERAGGRGKAEAEDVDGRGLGGCVYRGEQRRGFTEDGQCRRSRSGCVVGVAGLGCGHHDRARTGDSESGAGQCRRAGDAEGDWKIRGGGRA